MREHAAGGSAVAASVAFDSSEHFFEFIEEKDTVAEGVYHLGRFSDSPFRLADKGIFELPYVQAKQRKIQHGSDGTGGQ